MKMIWIGLLAVNFLAFPLKAASPDTSALLTTAQAHFEKGRYKKCISVCNKILDEQPRSSDAYYWKGRSMEALKKPLEAANEYQAALLAQKGHPGAEEGLQRVKPALNAATQ